MNKAQGKTGGDNLGGYFFKALIKAVIRPLVKSFWLKGLSGLENIPASGPFVLVANHDSVFDIPVIFSVVRRRMHFLTAEKFFKPWYWRLIMANTGQIMVSENKEERANIPEQAMAVLRSGRVLGIFPEGRRSPDGSLGKAFTGAARFALAAKVPVVPIGLSGAREIIPIGRVFPRIKKSVKVKIGPAIDLSAFYGRAESPAVLQEATDMIMAEIARLSGKGIKIYQAKEKKNKLYKVFKPASAGM